MDCAISAAVTSAAGAAGSQQAGGTTLCDQGKRFAELVQQAPTGAGAPGMIPLSAIVDTYVPAVANTAAGSGGSSLMSAIDHIRSLSLPSPGGQNGTPSSGDVDDLPTVGDDPAADLATVMHQSVAWQTEVIRISMLGDMVSSMNQGVKTLFQQQG
jgi:hypothetical protein